MKLAVLSALVAIAVPAGAAVTLPIEVVGDNGTTASVTVDVPAGRAREVRSLWMQVHGLGYAGMVSVQVNASTWFQLDNNAVAVQEPGKSYGGIGGGFATLKITLPLPADTVVAGANTIRFRFNFSNGVTSGFRVLAFNFLTVDSSALLAPNLFVQEDPRTWEPPLRDPQSIRAGQGLWQAAPLKANNLLNAPRIRAHCADCHAYDGRDLKYFNFSNASIIERSRFHGLTYAEGQQIASYIRSLSVPNPGQPWNPPYQPGPGLDAQPVANWAAGAGLSWVLEKDVDTLGFVFPSMGTSGGAPMITAATFSPDGNLNPREIPISLQLPDWNHWLPRIHPLDAWGSAFEKSEFSTLYGTTATKASLRSLLASPNLTELITTGRIAASFDKWIDARRSLLKPYAEGKPNWSPELGTKVYSTQLWQLVKTWELTQQFGLEGRGRELFGPSGEPRTWFNAIPAATAPTAANIPDGPAGMGGSAPTNEYFDAAWYELQILLNGGNHRHRNRLPVDWVYVIGQYLDLYRETQRPEPARLLVTVIKALQSTDPAIGPENRAQGWRPNLNVDPTIMVREAWAPIFRRLPGDAKRALTEALLTAWLDKNQQYPVARYFTLGVTERYVPSAALGGISGTNVWEAAPLFTAAGVNPGIVRQLQQWGAAFTDMAARFQYSAPPTGGKGTGAAKTGAK